MSFRIFIKNASIVNEGSVRTGHVVVGHGRIEIVICPAADEPDRERTLARAAEEIERRYAGNFGTVEAGGCLLLPGVIDDHVHFRDPGLTYKADIGSESRAAAAGGVTSYMDMPNCVPMTVTPEALEAKFRRAAEVSRVNYSFYFGATNDNFPLLESLPRIGHRPCGVKLFMGASTGNMLVDRRESLERIFGGTDLLIATHCEDSARIAENMALFRREYPEERENEAPARLHALIRDEEACYRSSSLAVELAGQYGARLHVLHVTTARELSLFSDGPVAGKQITAEACLAHLLFSEEDYDVLGNRIKCNPSVKALSDREALRNALRTGRIDVVGTDHAPHLLEEKEKSVFRAVSGMPMIQFSLVSMLDLCRAGVLDYPTVVEKMCHAPARLFRIKERGFIRRGYKADLVLVRPEAPWTLRREDVVSKCGWSPLEGHTFHHKVLFTLVNGQLAFRQGHEADDCRGEALQFEA